jgi:cystathionine beta-synthase
MGTGGTISGIGRYLKERNPNIGLVGVDPEGSMYHHEFYGTKGDIHSYKVEGIGEDFLPGTLNLKLVDEIVTVTDKEAFLMARKLAQEEGIFAGGSAGSALFAALQVANRPESKGKVIVVILPDTGRNYLNKIYSDDWMTENGYIEARKKISVSHLLSNKINKQPPAPYSQMPKLVATSLMKNWHISTSSNQR